MLETGVVPGNRNLESVDPLERGNVHLALGDRPIRLAEPLKAALMTSLGFGHVSAVLAIAHPDTFLAALDDRDDYLRRAGRRRAQGVQRRLETRLGRPPRPPQPPRTRDDEAACLNRGLTPFMLGVDLVDVPGVRGAARRHRERLRRRRRSPRASSATAKGDARRLAARFAAKEAFVKAWSGSRYGQPPLLARDRPARDRGRRRRLRPSRPAPARRGGRRRRPGRDPLSLSHDGPRRSRSSSSSEREPADHDATSDGC